MKFHSILVLAVLATFNATLVRAATGNPASCPRAADGKFNSDQLLCGNNLYQYPEGIMIVEPMFKKEYEQMQADQKISKISNHNPDVDVSNMTFIKFSKPETIKDGRSTLEVVKPLSCSFGNIMRNNPDGTFKVEPRFLAFIKSRKDELKGVVSNIEKPTPNEIKAIVTSTRVLDDTDYCSSASSAGSNCKLQVSGAPIGGYGYCPGPNLHALGGDLACAVSFEEMGGKLAINLGRESKKNYKGSEFDINTNYAASFTRDESGVITGVVNCADGTYKVGAAPSPKTGAPKAKSAK